MSDEKAFDAELAREMVAEARESLDSVVPQLLILRARPEDPEPIKKVFRTFHTIKGNAGMVGLEGIAEFAHRAETALNLLREGERSVTDERISLFVEAVDLLAFLFDALDYEAGREGGDGSELDFLERLESAFAEDADPEMSVCVKLSDWLDEVGCDDVLADHPRVAELAAWFERYAPPPEIVEEALQGATPEGEEDDATTSEEQAVSRALTQTKPSHSSLRVDVDAFDEVLTLAGELFNVHERLKFWIHGGASPERMATQRNALRGIARDFDSAMDRIYKQLLGMRRFPTSQITRPLERLIREVCRATGKQARLAIMGEDLMLDKQILELLHDPLVHMIRNSIDHGVEEEAQRVAAGKDPVATITLSFCEADENVHVLVRDDGRGIDLEAVKAKAIVQGLVGAAEAERLSESQQIELIYHPGLSTRKEVSDLSGRGVGMDVVISTLRQAGGSVHASTIEGEGTQFLLEVPKLGSPVIEGLAARIGRVNYLLPTKCVDRFMSWSEVTVSRLPTGEIVSNLVEGCVPVVELEALHKPGWSEGEPGAMGVVIEDRNEHRYLLPVDGVLGWQKVLVARIDHWFDPRSVLDGAFVLGDGSIGFTVCPERLHRHLRRMVRSEEPQAVR